MFGSLLLLRGESGSLSESIIAALPHQSAFCRHLVGSNALSQVDPGVSCGLFAPSLTPVRWQHRKAVATLLVASAQNACPAWDLKAGRFARADKVVEM